MASHLLDVLAHRAEVVAWHTTLPPKQQREWAAPITIKKHCAIFAKPDDGAAKRPSAYAQMKDANIAL